MIIGNRIPREYFIATGQGESEIDNRVGSFDAALTEAKIHNYNIIKYSSIMPRDAVRVDPPKKITHGSVMECIMASKDGKKGETLTAGIILGWVFDKESGENVGGLVAEYSGSVELKDADQTLNKMLDEMFASRYDTEKFEIGEKEQFVRSFIPKKEYGTVVVAICFTSYDYPVLD